MARLDEIDDEADPKAALVSLLLGRAAASVGDPGRAAAEKLAAELAEVLTLVVQHHNPYLSL